MKTGQTAVSILRCDFPVVCKNVQDERVVMSKHNYDVVVSFIKLTTCFGNLEPSPHHAPSLYRDPQATS